jgi:hypothetical protein
MERITLALSKQTQLISGEVYLDSQSCLHNIVSGDSDRKQKMNAAIRPATQVLASTSLQNTCNHNMEQRHKGQGRSSLIYLSHATVSQHHKLIYCHFARHDDMFPDLSPCPFQTFQLEKIKIGVSDMECPPRINDNRFPPWRFEIFVEPLCSLLGGSGRTLRLIAENFGLTGESRSGQERATDARVGGGERCVGGFVGGRRPNLSLACVVDDPYFLPNVISKYCTYSHKVYLVRKKLRIQGLERSGIDLGP